MVPGNVGLPAAAPEIAAGLVGTDGVDDEAAIVDEVPAVVDEVAGVADVTGVEVDGRVGVAAAATVPRSQGFGGDGIVD